MIKFFTLISFILFYLCPILWVLNISLQDVNAAFNDGYKFIPDFFNPNLFNAYSAALKSPEITNAITLSIGISLISTLLGVFFSITAIYIIKADIVTDQYKSWISQLSIGLFFLPVFIIPPGLKLLNHVYKFDSYLQLIFVNTIFGYVISFILFCLIYANSKRSYFEQLLLETGSRLKAFFFGIITPNSISSLLVISFTFATIWSEFFLSNIIMSTNKFKPFAVVLQRASKQYGTDYSTFAAGAAISLSIWIAIILFSIFIGFVLRALAKGRKI